MEEKNAYLDSSALLKRYLAEDGTDIVDELFKEAEMKNTVLYLSIWNIGEVVGVLDKRGKAGEQKRISDFLNEVKRLAGASSLKTVEITLPILFDSISIVIAYKVYIADALQIVSCKHSKCQKFFTGDRKLHNAAKREGLDSVFLGKSV